MNCRIVLVLAVLVVLPRCAAQEAPAPGAEAAAVKATPPAALADAKAAAEATAAGAKGPAVQKSAVEGIQGTLKSAGFYDGPVDGVMNAKTQAAMEEFRKAAEASAAPRPGPCEAALLGELKEAIRRFESCGGASAGGDRAIEKGPARGVGPEGEEGEPAKATEGSQAGGEAASASAGATPPFSDVLGLLGPFRERGEKSGLDLRVRSRKGCDATYFGGESLLVDVTAKKPLRYVYVDYYVADRKAVAHLFPSPKQPENLVKEESRLSLGGPLSRSQWQIKPPYGPELLTVIVSAKPIFDKQRQPAEPAGSYLEDLRRALPGAAAGSDVAAESCFIQTREAEAR